MRRRTEKIPGFVSKTSWPVPFVPRNAIRMAAANAVLHTLLKSAAQRQAFKKEAFHRVMKCR